MSKLEFTVSIGPQEALDVVKTNLNADLVHEEVNDLSDGKMVGILIFEKYYIRAGNKVALTVIADNLKGNTGIRSIATASSRDAIFNFDLGASDNLANRTRNILSGYVLSEEIK